MKDKKHGTSFEKGRGVILGGAITLAALLMLWSAGLHDNKNSGQLSNLKNSTVEIDPSSPTSDNNDQAVFGTSEIESSEIFEDEYLKPIQAVLLTRDVQMYQWQEYDDKKGGWRYQLEWVPGYVDFFSFHESVGHENPALTVQPYNKHAANVRFGKFDISELVKYFRPEAITINPAMLKDPSVEISNGSIYLHRGISGTAPGLGDIKVSYRALLPGTYTVLAHQVDQNTLSIGKKGSEAFLFAKKGEIQLDELLNGVKSEGNFSLKFYLISGVLLCFGLVSILLPFKEKISLKPTYDLEGIRAVWGISFGLTVIIVVLTVVITWIGG